MRPRFRAIPSSDDPEYTRPPDETYSIDEDAEYRQHQAVDHVISERLINRITGRGDGQARLYGNTPSRRCFAGVLANQYRYREAQAEGDSFENIAQDVAPFSIGLKFQVAKEDLDDTVFEISPDAKLYYQRFPTYDEQMRYADVGSGRYEDPTLTPEERDAVADGGAPDEDQSLLSVYERVDPEFDTFELSEQEIRDALELDRTIERSVSGGFEAAREMYEADERAYRETAEGVDFWEVEDIPAERLRSENHFEEYLDEMFSDERKPVMWDAELKITANERQDGVIAVTVSLVNVHGENIETDEETDEDWQAYLFDAKVSVSTEKPVFQSFPSEEIRDHYQYDGNIYAIGDNCAIERQQDQPVTDLRTTTVPIYEQPKYLSRDTVAAPFGQLAHGDIDEILANIESEMERAHEQYRSIEDQVLTADKSTDARKEFEENLEQFAAERERFHRGRELIKEDERVERAFRALNETFDSMGKQYKQWRLFQVVFIVMSLPDMVSQAEPDRPLEDALDVGDVIYFPTGGGKTEAYLGLVVFTAFYDRLRGKLHGMTALTKFPLRLLSLQQLQRITDVLCHAEEIRRERGMGGESFSIGYFVGKDNTPNKTYVSKDKGADTNNVELAQDDSDIQKEWRMIEDCPYCDKEGTVEITGDIERMRIIHQCTNQDCDEVERQGGDAAELPIYITDEEVYRYTPTFVVSTIDKIAIVGWQRRMRTLFGRVKNRCPKHGYTSEQECFISDRNTYPSHIRCDGAGLKSISDTDPPSILIQDELHLLREEFGAFDSHYETFLQELISRYTDGKWQMKVIAATATIEGADEQVNALYWRDSNVFPTPGPRLHQSFYAYEHPHKLGRRMVGAIPRSVSRTLAINSVIRERAMVVQELQARPEELDESIHSLDMGTLGGPLELPEAEEERHEHLLDLLKEYEVQVSYNIAKTRSDMLQRNVKQMLNDQLEAFGEPYHKLTSVALTGETDMDVVRDALSRLEADDPANPIDIIIATSMISHGVDIDKLNFISFFGMPRNTAEYIQAYSRVGRKHTGTVFVLFDAMRARDRSHYTRFEHYHRYQDLLVEATPLERWAQFAIDRTMPGLLVGLFLQYYHHIHEGKTDSSLYQFKGYTEALRRDLITREDALEFILRAYSVTEDQERPWSDSYGMQLYRDRIETQFDEVWDRLLEDPLSKDPREEFITNVAEGDEEGENGPMNSLRDIDQQIDIIPNRYSTLIVENFRGSDN